MKLNKRFFVLALVVFLVVGMGSAVMAQDNYGDVDQEGSNNGAYIMQDSDNKASYDQGNHYGTIFQSGNSNLAGQEAYGANSVLTINSEGSYNKAYQTQGLWGVGSGSTGDIDQTGNGNFAAQSFGQQGQYARIYQDGNYNTATQNMDEGVVNEQRAYQYGEWNVSHQKATGKYNFSQVTQAGDSNFAFVMQSAEHNNADVVQSGFGNAGFVNQSSNNNDANITQSGNNNGATIIQN
ncbi:curlin associated repeat protein [Halanaerobium saccharolyticum]|uniref:Curlin associated repeat protein n=1 Tax=Halanaerobium saccharolyticum TaxID=43595 RepID=A0A4R6LSF9_9FIRM|nr:hypothetical protein [Halanaerobium saccharolyticum]TDO91277.1 curlin associated repeat protein [Halanaerobium saccharolyticum]